MGSATTQALAGTTAALGSASGVDIDVARELFAAARAVGDTSALSGALADSAAASAARAKVVADVFGAALRPVSVSLLTAAVSERWSSASDMVDGLEELAIRAAAVAEPASPVEDELFRFSRTVAENPELELALGSRLGDASAKGALVDTLLTGRSSEAARLIVSSLVQQPRDAEARDCRGGAGVVRRGTVEQAELLVQRHLAYQFLEVLGCGQRGENYYERAHHAACLLCSPCL